MTISYSDRPLDRMVVHRLLTERAVATPDLVFLRFGDETVTYGQMHSHAMRYASALENAGVARGDMVALMMRNSIEYVSVYFGLVYRGAAVVLINTAFRGYMLEYVLNDAGCSLLIADDDLLPVIDEAQPRLHSLRHLLVAAAAPTAAAPTVGPSGVAAPAGPAGAAATSTPAAGDVVLPRRNLATALARAGESGPDDSVGYADLHCVVYSSGTTGPSKGIMISNGHAVAKAFEVIKICEFTSADILYSPLPLFYSMGLLRGVLSVALTGASIVLREKFSVSAYWEEVRRTGATVAHSVFAIPRMLQNHPPAPGDRDHRLRCMFNARHDPQFEKRFGVRLIEGYGLTEAGNAIFSRLSEPAVPGSCGQVSGEWQVRIADPDGQEVPAGDIGEILIRPLVPQRIMMGYLNKPEQTANATRDLWLHTGDLASRDEAGYYFYKGRLKDMIRRRGQNISAWEVEQIIMEYPSIGEVAAVAHPSEVGEDDLRVVLTSAPGERVELSDLAAYCGRRMPKFMVPRYFELRVELPRTPSGRIEKYRLASEPFGSAVLDLGEDRRAS